MNLQEQINADYLTAYKAKEELTIATLRLLKSALQNAGIVKGEALVDDDVIKVIKKEAKQRKESIEAFEKGGQAEMAKKEAAELKILEKYLPEELSEEETTRIVTEVIASIPEAGPSKMGQIIGLVMKETKGRADGGVVSRLVQSLLNK